MQNLMRVWPISWENSEVKLIWVALTYQTFESV